MPLHLIKLSVGSDSIETLQGWINARLKEKKRRGQKVERFHVTRMMPKRVEELLGGGSMYWVIRGEILCREKLLGVVPFRDKDGISRCRLVMEGKLIPVGPRPYRAFQGWRYLPPDDAPRDMTRSARAAVSLPEPLRRELRELGLL